MRQALSSLWSLDGNRAKWETRRRSGHTQSGNKKIPLLPALSLPAAVAKALVSGSGVQRPARLGAAHGHVAVTWPAESYPLT